MDQLVIATHNQGKVEEFRRILAPLGVQVSSCRELGMDAEVEETGTTFAENARLKAKEISQRSGLPAVADDSGLCVDALGGAPGIYSARYAGPEAVTDADRVVKLLQELEAVPEEQRGAQFVCAICCYFPDGSTITAENQCPGRLTFAPRGASGFGYDPIFIPDGMEGTFSELSGAEKDAISHRGKALRAFSEKLRGCGRL